MTRNNLTFCNNFNYIIFQTSIENNTKNENTYYKYIFLNYTN